MSEVQGFEIQAVWLVLMYVPIRWTFQITQKFAIMRHPLFIWYIIYY